MSWNVSVGFCQVHVSIIDPEDGDQHNNTYIYDIWAAGANQATRGLREAVLPMTLQAMAKFRIWVQSWFPCLPDAIAISSLPRTLGSLFVLANYGLAGSLVTLLFCESVGALRQRPRDI